MLLDGYNRKITYLRLSVTDRCGLRCMYCNPGGAAPFLPREEMLSYEEILEVVRAALRSGIDKVRLTGGEPLLRRNLLKLVGDISSLEGLRDLALSTSGVALKSMALPLRRAGLRRVNVSLDSLNAERYRDITGGGSFNEAWLGLEAAQDCGLTPVKINMVLLRGVNTDEIWDFTELVLRYPWQVRFIELRSGNRLYEKFFISAHEARRRINHRFSLRPLEGPGSSTARIFTFAGARGSLGFIGKAEEALCPTCNRLRLDAAGRLYSCLFSPRYLDVKSVLRRGGSLSGLSDCFRRAVAQKPLRLCAGSQLPPMSQMGG